MTAKRYDPKKAARPSAKGLLLFILPLPLLIAVFVSLAKGAFFGVLANVLGFTLFLFGAIVARKGFRLEREYNRRKIARAPGTPYKLIAGVFIAVATGITALWGAGYGLLISVAFGIAAFSGYYLLYGIDPRRDKIASPTVGVTAEEVFDALDEAEQTISAIDAARDKVGNRELRDRLRRITDKAREVVETIAEDPRDLRRARKFLTVYLDSTRRVTEGYARTHKMVDSDQLEENFRRVLDNIEQVFQEQQTRLLEDNVWDLDVQIEVLEAQLKHEGVI